ncbi:hypothetical protein GpartN1_g2909.t1 [Galdieria partita]|uniref:Mannosyltransferase n=1 Tax=Galdieria partita TaxID=83374 RepID=A0A9C7PUH4_9RHOD|nr:hypothetical protein GpartN1_g2909.t1 [Galdieria partita]
MAASSDSKSLQRLHESPKDEETLRAFTESAKNTSISQRDKRTWKLREVLFSKAYLGLVLLRWLLLCLPGYISNDEYYYTDWASRDVLGLPVVVPEEMDLTPPCHSALAMFLISGFPLYLFKLLKQSLYFQKYLQSFFGNNNNYGRIIVQSGLGVFILPRIVPFILSLFQDVLILKICDRKRSFARNALFAFGLSWPALCLFPRPTSAIWQSICLLMILLSLLRVEKVRNIFSLYAFATALGIFIDPTFVIYAAGLLPLLLFGSGASSFRKYVMAILVFLVTFLSTCFVFILFDSFYFGTLHISLAGKVIQNPMEWWNQSKEFLADSSLKELLFSISLRGKVLVTSLNYYATVVPWKSWLRFQFQADFTHLLYHLPVLVGPCLLLLFRYMATNSTNMYKELMDEYKKMTSANESRKKKKKKSSTTKSSKSKQQQEEAFFEPIELAIMLAFFALSFSRQQEITQLAPIMTCLSMMTADDLLGRKQKRWMHHLFIAYSITGVVVFGMLHQSGVVSWLLHESIQPSVVGSHSHLICYRTFRPPPSLLGEQLGQFQLYHLGENVTSEQLLSFLSDLETMSNDQPIFVGTSATVALKFDELRVHKTLPGHLTVTDLPATSYGLLTESKFVIYRYWSKISAAVHDATGNE